MTPPPFGSSLRARSFRAGYALLLAGVLGALPPIVAAQVPGEGPPPALVHPEAGVVLPAEPPPIGMGQPPAPGRYDGRLDILHYHLQIDLPATMDRIEGRARIRFVWREASVGPIRLDLTGLAVGAVRLDGVEVPFRHEEGEILFELPAAAEGTHEVEIFYGGVPDDGLILGRNVHGQPTAFADNWPNRARFWFPSQDHPSDRASVSFRVRAPEGMRVVANGLPGTPEEPAPDDGSARTHRLWAWDSPIPIPTYLMVIGVGPLEVRAGTPGACGASPASPRADRCAEVSTWAFAPDLGHAERVFARSGAMLDFYAALLGPYPFEKLANIQSSTRFGGMENASAIFYAEEPIARGANIEPTVAHEIAHQWFGNWVTPADWPHLWLSEGFASYFGPLFFETAEGPSVFRGMIDGNRRRYLGSQVQHRPVVDRDAANLLDLLNANSYQKGSLVLHMLRGVMGDEAFFRSMRRYVERFGGGTADTDDLLAVVEEVHGAPLDWFFDQWLHSPGHPVYRVDWSWDEGAGAVDLRVGQEQDPSWPAFRMPVELEFEVPGVPGPIRRTEWIEGREWRGRIPLPGRPTGFRFDPDGRVLGETVVSPG